ncbi:hypothetical protein C8J56DRAFT_1049461 [Mycena floridula]|nr:hypothetical protein C8J56DRAFT_1049461 [Mycena floridula]
MLIVVYHSYLCDMVELFNTVASKSYRSGYRVTDVPRNSAPWSTQVTSLIHPVGTLEDSSENLLPQMVDCPRPRFTSFPTLPYKGRMAHYPIFLLEVRAWIEPANLTKVLRLVPSLVSLIVRNPKQYRYEPEDTPSPLDSELLEQLSFTINLRAPLLPYLTSLSIRLEYSTDFPIGSSTKMVQSRWRPHLLVDDDAACVKQVRLELRKCSFDSEQGRSFSTCGEVFSFPSSTKTAPWRSEPWLVTSDTKRFVVVDCIPLSSSLALFSFVSRRYSYGFLL